MAPLDGVHLIVVGPHIWRLSVMLDAEAKAWVVELKTHERTMRLVEPKGLFTSKQKVWQRIAARLEIDTIIHKTDNRRKAGR